MSLPDVLSKNIGALGAGEISDSRNEGTLVVAVVVVVMMLAVLGMAMVVVIEVETGIA